MQNQHQVYKPETQAEQYSSNASDSDNYSHPSDESYEDSHEMNQEEGRKGRRSKHDNDGRVHVCDCGKTYLSYPALYTHIKQKHSRGPGGEIRAPPTSGRGRGRPRKNVSPFLA